MPNYKVTFEIEADDSDGAMEMLSGWEAGNIHVLLLDEPEPDEE